MLSPPVSGGPTQRIPCPLPPQLVSFLQQSTFHIREEGKVAPTWRGPSEGGFATRGDGLRQAGGRGSRSKSRHVGLLRAGLSRAGVTRDDREAYPDEGSRLSRAGGGRAIASIDEASHTLEAGSVEAVGGAGDAVGDGATLESSRWWPVRVPAGRRGGEVSGSSRRGQAQDRREPGDVCPLIYSVDGRAARDMGLHLLDVSLPRPRPCALADCVVRIERNEPAILLEWSWTCFCPGVINEGPLFLSMTAPSSRLWRREASDGSREHGGLSSTIHGQGDGEGEAVIRMHDIFGIIRASRERAGLLRS